MSGSFKQRFSDEVKALLQSVSVTPEAGHILISQPLHDAIHEIEAEVNGPRTNWHLVAALTGTKSFIVTMALGQTCSDPFWAQQRAEDEPSVYGILDDLHFRAAMRANVLPSGMSAFGRTADGVGVRHGEVDTSASSSSPTLRLITVERARIDRAATNS